MSYWVVNEKFIIFKNKEKKRKRKGNVAQQRVYLTIREKEVLTYHKPVYRSYTSRPSDLDAKYQLAKFGHAQKAKFQDKFLGLKVTQQSFFMTFTFLFLSSFLFLHFLPLFFFSLAGHFNSRLHFGGKSF